ncbi:MAG: hypothetical protein ACXVRW_18860 [Solirubrobacteraceae bacterium]
MPRSGVAEARGDRSQHDERRAARDAARAALLEWDARDPLPSAVRALDDWSTSERASTDSYDWSSDPAPPAPVARAASERDTAVPSDWSPSGGVAGRRTVTIRGQVADRYVSPHSSSRRRPERRYERSGFRPDRAAMWAFVLGVMLILAAVTSAHAATLHAVAHLH